MSCRVLLYGIQFVSDNQTIHPLHPSCREGVATRELARLYRDNGAVDKAAECYYHHLLLTGGGALVTAVQKVILGVCKYVSG